MIKDITCYLVACDDCGEPWGGEFGPYHFETEAGANRAFAGERDVDWTTCDGVYCYICREKHCWICDSCGEWFPRKEPGTTIDGETLCAPCAKELS